MARLHIKKLPCRWHLYIYSYFAARTGPSMAEGKPQYSHALNRTPRSTTASMTVVCPCKPANVQLIQERWEQQMWDERLPIMGSFRRMQNAKFRKDFGPVWDCLEDVAITFELQPESHCLDVHYNKLIPQISLPSQRYLLKERHPWCPRRTLLRRTFVTVGFLEPSFPAYRVVVSVRLVAQVLLTPYRDSSLDIICSCCHPFFHL